MTRHETRFAVGVSSLCLENAFQQAQSWKTRLLRFSTGLLMPIGVNLLASPSRERLPPGPVASAASVDRYRLQPAGLDIERRRVGRDFPAAGRR